MGSDSNLCRRQIPPRLDVLRRDRGESAPFGCDETIPARFGGKPIWFSWDFLRYFRALYVVFFDFADYSAFAIALSYIFGIHTPENFQRPFLARDIRDFWNRWHITLSFWFRDHVYMRFLLAATRGNWFANKYTASILAYFVTFGLMGVWHGLEPHYIFYGLCQAGAPFRF
jgi:membrane protein involved in D-alanine export